jgi:hypothetical protein
MLVPERREVTLEEANDLVRRFELYWESLYGDALYGVRGGVPVSDRGLPSISDESQQLLEELEDVNNSTSYLVIVKDSVRKYGLIILNPLGDLVRMNTYHNGVIQELLDWSFIELRGTSNGLPDYFGRLESDDNIGAVIALTPSGLTAARAFLAEGDG